jgi:hypothetical protein
MPNIRFIAFFLVTGFTFLLHSSTHSQALKKRELTATAVTTLPDLPGPDSTPRVKKTRGYCYIYCDNNTGSFVDIWVEGVYQGRLSPYTTSVRLDIWVPDKWANIYMQTTDGKLCWKATGYCNDSRVLVLRNGKISSSKPNLKD